MLFLKIHYGIRYSKTKELGSQKRIQLDAMDVSEENISKQPASLDTSMSSIKGKTIYRNILMRDT